MKKLLLLSLIAMPAFATGDYQQSQVNPEEEHALPESLDKSKSPGNPLLPINQDYYYDVFNCWRRSEIGARRYKELAIVDPESIVVSNKDGVISYNIYRIQSLGEGKVRLLSQAISLKSKEPGKRLEAILHNHLGKKEPGKRDAVLHNSPEKKDQLKFMADGSLSPESKSWQLSFALMRDLGRPSRGTERSPEVLLENIGQAEGAAKAFASFIKDHQKGRGDYKSTFCKDL